jgi:hypothetical protein
VKGGGGREHSVGKVKGLKVWRSFDSTVVCEFVDVSETTDDVTGIQEAGTRLRYMIQLSAFPSHCRKLILRQPNPGCVDRRR